jgi:ribosomal protein S27AE
MAKVKERPRRCAKCGYSWWGQESRKPHRMGFIASSGLAGGGWDAAAVASSHAFNRAEASKAWERWAICPRCGSQDIHTVSERGFIPTSLAEAEAAAAFVAAAPQAQPPTAHAPRMPGRDPNGTWALGASVIVRQLGYRGLTGTVVRRGPLGNYTITLDRGGKAKSIPGDKLDPV